MSDAFPLSPAGEDRRAEILQLAQAEARRRRRRRQSARAAVAGAGVILVTVLLTHRRMPPKPATPMVIVPAPTTRPVAVTHPLVAPRPKPRQIVIQFIKTEPNLAKRMAAPPQEPTWRRLNDDELIQALADAGHPAGLAWVDGREFVLYRPPGGARGGGYQAGTVAPPR